MAAATKKNQPQPQPQAPVVPTPVDEDTLVAEQAATDLTDVELELERLQAQHRADAARIKELRAMQPKVSKLDRVTQRQAEQPKWLGSFVNGRIRERMQAGQTYDEALTAVLDHFRYLAQPPAPKSK